jgi:8-oxo-dGTP diphosphatase
LPVIREDDRVSEPQLRVAVRAVILDDRDSILLVRFDLSGRIVWAAPGGGIEVGEDAAEALEREMVEEVGLRDARIGPLIWTRTHLFEMTTGHDGQREHFYLVRAPHFDPRPTLTQAQLEAENVTAMRWWSLSELDRSDADFAPRRLPMLLRSLIDGPLPGPIDAGV